MERQPKDSTHVYVPSPGRVRGDSEVARCLSWAEWDDLRCKLAILTHHQQPHRYRQLERCGPHKPEPVTGEDIRRAMLPFASNLLARPVQAIGQPFRRRRRIEPDALPVRTWRAPSRHFSGPPASCRHENMPRNEPRRTRLAQPHKLAPDLCRLGNLCLRPSGHPPDQPKRRRGRGSKAA